MSSETTAIARRCGGSIPADILALPWTCPPEWTMAQLRAEIERRVTEIENAKP